MHNKSNNKRAKDYYSIDYLVDRNCCSARIMWLMLAVDAMLNVCYSYIPFISIIFFSSIHFMLYKYVSASTRLGSIPKFDFRSSALVSEMTIIDLNFVFAFLFLFFLEDSLFSLNRLYNS